MQKINGLILGVFEVQPALPPQPPLQKSQKLDI